MTITPEPRPLRRCSGICCGSAISEELPEHRVIHKRVLLRRTNSHFRVNSNHRRRYSTYDIGTRIADRAAELPGAPLLIGALLTPDLKSMQSAPLELPRLQAPKESANEY